MMTEQLFLTLPAKADKNNDKWLPLWLHLEDTGGVMRWLCRNWLPAQEQLALSSGLDVTSLESLAVFLGQLHDIGKATPSFVSHILRAMPALGERLRNFDLELNYPMDYRKVPHAAAGEAIFFQFFQVNAPISSIIGAHHGKPQSSENYESLWENYGFYIFGKRDKKTIWQNTWKELLHRAETNAGVTISCLPAPALSAQALLTGLLIMADWIASNTIYFPLLPLDENGSDIDIDLRLNTAMDRLRLPPCWQSTAEQAWGSAIYDLRFGQGEARFLPRPMQEAAAEIAAGMERPGLLMIEASMGSGKTEAALAAAEFMAARSGSGGIFFGLPTQATSDAMFRRVKEWAQAQDNDTPNSIQLTHRMAAFNLDFRTLMEGGPNDVDVQESGLEVHSFFQGRKTSLLASFTVGTVDQLLMAALKRKHVMLRHLGIAGKVVILDEVHAYDAYMGQYLQRALSWLGAWRCPVILLSATLPKQTRCTLMDAYLGNSRKKAEDPWRENEAYPLLTWSDGGAVFQYAVQDGGPGRTVKIRRMADSERIELLRDCLSAGGCAGVICNTVSRAQKAAMELQTAFPETEVLLLHAGFAAPHRARIERKLLALLGKRGSRPEKLILVGTQVLEQSLDIDLDLMVTDLCPMDLLLQRIGRLHRHNRERPEKLREALCAVTCCGDEEIRQQKIYQNFLLLRTRALLPAAVNLPLDISPLVQSAYRDITPEEASDANLRDAWEAFENDRSDRKRRANVYRLNSPYKDEKQKPATLDGLLDTDLEGDDKLAEASVRDGGNSVEVLLLRREGENMAAFVTGDRPPVALDRVPSEEEAMEIARQRLRLPYVLCLPKIVGETVRELEALTALAAPEWQYSPWLHGELLLLLDAAGSVEINNHVLQYDLQYGILCEKKEKERGVEDGTALQPD